MGYRSAAANHVQRADSGHRRLVFVRNEHSLTKPATVRAIKAIVKATPKGAADDMVVANAADYPRQRRDNLFRSSPLRLLAGS